MVGMLLKVCVGLFAGLSAGAFAGLLWIIGIILALCHPLFLAGFIVLNVWMWHTIQRFEEQDLSQQRGYAIMAFAVFLLHTISHFLSLPTFSWKGKPTKMMQTSQQDGHKAETTQVFKWRVKFIWMFFPILERVHYRVQDVMEQDGSHITTYTRRTTRLVAMCLPIFTRRHMMVRSGVDGRQPEVVDAASQPLRFVARCWFGLCEAARFRKNQQQQAGQLSQPLEIEDLLKPNKAYMRFVGNCLVLLHLVCVIADIVLLQQFVRWLRLFRANGEARDVSYTIGCISAMVVHIVINFGWFIFGVAAVATGVMFKKCLEIQAC